MGLKLGAPSASALSATFASAVPSIGERLRRAAASARRNNSVELGVMASPPTVTLATAQQDTGLTNTYTTSGGTLAGAVRFYGGSPQPGAGAFTAYTVFPVITRPSGSGGNVPGDATKSSYCHGQVFMTDAPKVELELLGGSQNLMFEVDDQLVSATVSTTASGGGSKWVLLDFTSAGGSKVRRIRVEQVTGTGIASIRVGPTYKVWRPQNATELVVATVGDSIDTGTSTTFPNGSWQQVAGKLLGWTDVRQVSFGGTGFTNNASTLNTFGAAQRVADVVATNPDLVVISASQNDDSGQAGLQAAALAAFQAYRTALPTKPIVCVGVDASSTGPSATRIATETIVKAAFDQWADSNSFWIPVTPSAAAAWETGTGTTGATTGTGNRDRFGADASHPNDAGHAYLGQRFAQAFRSLVLPYVK